MDGGAKDLAALLPNIAAQARGALSSLRLAAAQLAPAEAREQDPELDHQAALLDQSYYRLLRLVNNLSLAACMDGERPLRLQDRDLVELIGEQCERAAGLAELMGLQFKFVCPLERHICAVDIDILEQILSQLLSNALKFTDQGGCVTVELRLLPKRVLISVEDTGCGIPEERLTMLFAPLSPRGVSKSTRAGPGAGAGAVSAAGRLAQRRADGRLPAWAGQPLHIVTSGPTGGQRRIRCGL